MFLFSVCIVVLLHVFVLVSLFTFAFCFSVCTELGCTFPLWPNLIMCNYVQISKKNIFSFYFSACPLQTIKRSNTKKDHLLETILKYMIDIMSFNLAYFKIIYISFFSPASPKIFCYILFIYFKNYKGTQFKQCNSGCYTTSKHNTGGKMIKITTKTTNKINTKTKIYI